MGCKNSFFNFNISRKIKISLMVSTLVVLINIFSGCVSPEENDLLFITSLISIPLVVLLLVIVLLAAIFVRKNRATLKALAYYLLMINLMFIINFLTPYWILLESKTSHYSYILILGNALLGGIVVYLFGVVFKRFDENIINPIKSGLFGALFVFVVTFGYFVISKEFQNYLSIGMGHYSYLIRENLFSTMALGQAPYAAFLVAPFIAVVWQWGVNIFKKSTWTPHELLRNNIFLLWLIWLSLIIITVIIDGNKMARLGSELHYIPADYIEEYANISGLRDILFFNTSHNLIVATIFSFGVINMYTNNSLYKYRKYVFAVGVLLSVILVTIPYFIGQLDTVDTIAKLKSAELFEQNEIRESLAKAHPLYPGSTMLAHLLVSISGGGALLLTMSFPKLSFVGDKTD